jgi:hypothetical protein
MIPLVTNRNHVYYDEEIPITGMGKHPVYGWDFVKVGVPGAEHPLRFFQSSMMTVGGLPKTHGVHTNMIGSGGAIPNGQIFDMKAIRVSGWPHDQQPELKGTPRVVLRFGAGENGPMFDLRLEPGKLHELEKPIRFWGMECFEVQVFDVSEPVRVELHGDLQRYGHSSRVSPTGEQLFELGESEIQDLLALVGKALPETKDADRQRRLSWLHRSLRDATFGTYVGGYHVAQLMKGDVSVAVFETTEARDAHMKAVKLVADRLSASIEDVACWLLPEELDKIEDPTIRERATEAWKQIVSRYED